ncbi:MAG: hypothetical protein ACOCZK_03180 [Planctomycetota bacterium]
MSLRNLTATLALLLATVACGGGRPPPRSFTRQPLLLQVATDGSIVVHDDLRRFAANEPEALETALSGLDPDRHVEVTAAAPLHPRYRQRLARALMHVGFRSVRLPPAAPPRGAR